MPREVLANMKPELFVANLQKLKFESAFNPYTDVCEKCDDAHSPRLRSKVLVQILEAATDVAVDSIWLGRDLGYRGGRRTGLAFTDDVNFFTHTERWNISAVRPLTDDIVAERTATMIWQILSKIKSNVFLWNVFPLHPHEAGNHFCNRRHSSKEQVAGVSVLNNLIDLLRPKQLVAIGNDAAKVKNHLTASIPVHSVRHPSFGGKTQFESQIKNLYKIYSVECKTQSTS